MFNMWMMFANSCCNPVVYAVLNRNYRREFKRLLRCQSLSNMLYRTQDSTYDRRFSFDTKSFFKSNATSHGDRNFVKRKRNKSDDVSMENGMTQVTQSNASRSTRGSGQSNGANEFGKPLVCIESNL